MLCWAQLAQNARPIFGACAGMLEMGRGFFVRSDNGPLITEDLHLGSTEIVHRFNRQDEPFDQPCTGLTLHINRNLRRFVQIRADTVTDELADHRKTALLGALLNSARDVRHPVAYGRLFDALKQRRFGDLKQFADFRSHCTNRDGDGGIPVKPLIKGSEIEGNDITSAQCPFPRRSSLLYLLIH